MILTQKNHLVLPKDELDIVKKLCYHSARLYNMGLYNVRQHFFKTGKYLSYIENYHLCKTNENYDILHSDTSRPILKLIDRDMKSFFGSLKSKKNGTNDRKIKLPRYKNKECIMNFFIYGRSAKIKDGFVYIGITKYFREKYKIKLKKLKFKLPKNVKVSKVSKFNEIRIVPLFGGKEFSIEFVYEKSAEIKNLNPKKHLTIDFGLNNFATCFNSTNGLSFIIDGRHIKAINQWYNKEKARLQSIYDHQKISGTTNEIVRISQKRFHQINHYFNVSVKYITDYCIKNDIGSIEVGKNDEMKQEINLGKVTNQNFVQIPVTKFLRKLKSKCEMYGIKYEEQNESHTSKCSFLDMESVEHHEKYIGKRVKRGLFRTKDRLYVNSDVNGAGNILRKFLKSKQRESELSFSDCVVGFASNPRKLKLASIVNSFSKNHCINQ